MEVYYISGFWKVKNILVKVCSAIFPTFMLINVI
jgi:hypothetical protein